MNVVSKSIHDFLHFFHKPFSKFITRQQFRYIACGGFMAFFDVLMFAFVYNVLLHKEPLHIGTVTISAHVASLWIPFPVGFLMSYLLSRFVVFHETKLKNTTSLFRYTLLVISCVVVNYLLIKLFVEVCLLNAIVSKILCTLLVAGYSYVVQRYFAFKHPEPVIQ